MPVDSILPVGHRRKLEESSTPTPSPTPAPEPSPTPAPEPSPTPTPTASPAPSSSSTGSQPASQESAVQITSMLDAVRQAVILARSPAPANKWIDLPEAVSADADLEEAVARSKTDILNEASQAVLAQANQTRDSVMSLLRPPD